LAALFFYIYHELGRRMMLLGGVTVSSVQFEMDSWTGAQPAFAVKSFKKNNDSYIAAQHEFRKKFGIHRKSKLPSAHAIKTWLTFWYRNLAFKFSHTLYLK
jgi:hypothetical protein